MSTVTRNVGINSLPPLYTNVHSISFPIQPTFIISRLQESIIDF